MIIEQYRVFNQQSVNDEEHSKSVNVHLNENNQWTMKSIQSMINER